MCPYSLVRRLLMYVPHVQLVVGAATGQIVTVWRHFEATHAAIVSKLGERRHAGSLVNLLHTATILAAVDEHNNRRLKVHTKCDCFILKSCYTVLSNLDIKITYWGKVI